MVRSLIRSGVLVNSEQLIEDELVKMFDLPRVSIRQALVQLANEGLVIRQRHIGTRVSHPYYQIPVDDILPREAPPGFMIRTLDDRLVRSMPWIRENLGVDDDVVGMIEHVFEHTTGDGSEPIGVRIAYYRKECTQPASWATCPSLAVGFLRAFGKPLGLVETIVDAVASDEDTARMLHLAPGATVLMREQKLYDIDGDVQEYAFSHYRPDRVSFPITHIHTEAPARAFASSERKLA
ncbi:MAG: GntR family transcriptional regulator [Frondihabitans sp.]|nr:GntR family transcriptional regulator [Frondihabitans sp.]